MNIDRFFGTIVHFFLTHSIVTLIVAVVIVFLAYKKPKQTLKVFAIVVFFVVVVYVGFYLQEAFFSGVDFKGDIIEKQEGY